MELFSNFWNRQHFAGSVVYRPVFMRDMASGGRYFSKLLLYAMLFAGSKYSASSQSHNSQSIGLPYRRRFEELLHGSGPHFLFKSQVTTIQALLIVAEALFSWCDEGSLSWHYLGIAISMMIDLGLHAQGSSLSPSKGYSPEDVEVHRRVFWAAFGMNVYLVPIMPEANAYQPWTRSRRFIKVALRGSVKATTEYQFSFWMITRRLSTFILAHTQRPQLN